MKIDLNSIKKLIEIMKEHYLQEIDYEEGTKKIHLRKTENKIIGLPASLEQVSGETKTTPAGKTEEKNVDENRHEITSPMVGTFYEALKPGTETFVQPGDPIDEEKTVCIIEAMKVMNEIKAEINGVIEKVLVKNGQPVEFGQALFLVKKK